MSQSNLLFTTQKLYLSYPIIKDRENFILKEINKTSKKNEKILPQSSFFDVLLNFFDVLLKKIIRMIIPEQNYSLQSSEKFVNFQDFKNLSFTKKTFQQIFKVFSLSESLTYRMSLEEDFEKIGMDKNKIFTEYIPETKKILLKLYKKESISVLQLEKTLNFLITLCQHQIKFLEENILSQEKAVDWELAKFKAFADKKKDPSLLENFCFTLLTLLDELRIVYEMNVEILQILIQLKLNLCLILFTQTLDETPDLIQEKKILKEIFFPIKNFFNYLEDSKMILEKLLKLKKPGSLSSFMMSQENFSFFKYNE